MNQLMMLTGSNLLSLFVLLIQMVDTFGKYFLGLLKLQCTYEESLMSGIESILTAKGLDITKAIFLGFDGYSVMCGVNTGKY